MAHALAAIGAARGRRVLAGGVAVVPAGDRELGGLAAGAGLDVVENRESAGGLTGSLRLGLEWLGAPERLPAPESAMIFLADQPRVSAEVAAALVAAWRSGAGRILRPRYAGSPDEPGHPVLLDRAAWPLVHRLRGDAGLGRVLRRRPDWARAVDLPGTNPDVDTAEDLAGLQRGSATGGPLSPPAA